MSFNRIINVLKSPELVVTIQEYFGVKYIYDHSSYNNDNTLTRNRRVNIPKEYISFHKDYLIVNKFWYWVFIVGTELGDELFYATFIPFWFWNIDGAVGRRVIFLWSIIMYIGQALKDIIRWGRPGPPVIKLQSKWSVEYGFPSTHAMVAVSIPFSVLIFTQYRYIYPVSIGLIISMLWSSVVCLSRLYLGMHSVLDVIAGIMLTIVLMTFLVPLVDMLDIPIIETWYSPIIILTFSILMIYYYPQSDKWTPTRGDTTMTVSVCVGLQIGAWLNYHMGYLIAPDALPLYEIIWPNYQMFGLLILRTVIGLCCIVATRALGKTVSYAFVCAILGRNEKDVKNSENTLENKHKTTVELVHKYFTYGLIGFNTQFLLPNVFKILDIGRPDFYTEM
ncbi:SGPP1 family protein [Megaselia abdita]